MTAIQWTDRTWKPIGAFQGYEVSNAGEVRSLRGRTPRILAPRLGPHGYLGVCLRRDGSTYQRLVHRVVAEAFLGDPNGRWVNHLDGVKTHNTVVNLEWTTPSENNLHAYRSGLQPSRRGSGNGKAKLTEEIVREIRSERERGTLVRILADRYGVARSTISGVSSGLGWSHV